MYKIYFKQALQMLKQNLFISIISILGTALAIMMIMTIIVTGEVKNMNMAPELNRDRTLYITFQIKKDTTKGSMTAGNVTSDIINEYLLKLKTPQYISAMSENSSDRKITVNIEGSSDYHLLSLRNVDATFWKVFFFDFVAGNAFSEEEFKSGIRNAVLSESTAQKLFKGERPLGRTIQIGFKNYKVVGVIKDISPVFKYAGGDIWIPYTSFEKTLSAGSVVLIAKSKDDFPAIIAEVREAERRFGIEKHPWMLYLNGPEDQKTRNLNVMANSAKEFDTERKIKNRRTVFIFLILLIIPALNLSGFSLSRIKKRIAEIGIRKAFGAKKYVILIQVLYENMITSLIGGFIGLLLSYITIIWLKDWLLKIPEGSGVPISALLSPYIFLAVFIVCLLLNLLSAGMSAFRASRMTIVDSLTQNDR